MKNLLLKMLTKIKLWTIGLMLVHGLNTSAQVDTPSNSSSPLTVADINSEEYGNGTSIGFGILGDGLALIARHRLKSEDQIGLSVSYWGVVEYDEVNEEIGQIEPGILLRSEFNFFLGDTYKEKHKKRKVKKKYKKHYLSVKAGAGFSFVDVYTFGLTWHKERFFLENKKHSAGLDLGLTYNIVQNSDVDILGNGVGIFLRFDWNWFRSN